MKGQTMTHNPYKAAGFENRRAYLESLAEDFPADVVFALADILGPGEDFDGLITALEDAAESGDL
ncbi:RNA polymerase [bacterium]|nr:RNA polymerase [bacterium]